MIFYFSGTGNSEFVAKELEREFSDVAYDISSYSKNIIEDEILGFICPTYFFDLPQIIIDFIKNKEFKNIKYCYFIATYGGSPGSTFKSLKRLLKEKGVILNSGYGLLMTDNYTPIYKIDSMEKQIKTQENAEEELKKIIINIKARSNKNFQRYKIPLFISRIAKIFYKKARKTKKFYALNTCIDCKICENNCPTKSIKIVDSKPCWVKSDCTLCLKCVHTCPKNAIQYGNGKTEKNGQYYNLRLK